MVSHVSPQESKSVQDPVEQITDPFEFITVNTSKFSEDFGFDVLLGMDGPHGSLGGKITLTMGNFFDILVERGIVSPGSE